MKVCLCYHGRCFDGAAAAAVFERFYRGRIQPDADFHYTGLTHRAAGLFDEALFDGDENVIVDFKYSSSPRLTWWFDHHQSAFLTPEDAAHFRRDTSGRKFYDPSYKSCTKFLASVARDRFGFDPTALAELIDWADIIDGAQYPSAEAALQMETPGHQVALVLEGFSGGDIGPRLIPDLVRLPLAEVARQPYIADHFRGLLRRHQRSTKLIEQQARCEGGVVYFDLSEQDVETYNKFIPYYLFPDCNYSVGVSRAPNRVKVAVGSNPWNETAEGKNLASICERYGGGGHARVAAISFVPEQADAARQTAREIAEELRR